jgi:hypothetical protein
LFTSEGKVRAFVNIYLNDEDVRYLPAKEATAVSSATRSPSFRRSPVDASPLHGSKFGGIAALE